MNVHDSCLTDFLALLTKDSCILGTFSSDSEYNPIYFLPKTKRFLGF
jgi:hypothetical protein